MALAEFMAPEADSFGEEEQLPEALEQLAAWAEMPNVAAEVDESDANRIATRVIDEYDIDKASRSDWEDEARTAMDAVLQKTEAKSHPFPGASNVKFPLLTTAALQFGARSYPAIVQGDRVVRVKKVGPDPYGLKQERADRVGLHMSHQLLEDQEGWEDDLDILLHQLPIVGHGYRKVYRDHEAGQNLSEFVSAMNVVVNQNTKDIMRVPRITEEMELYPHEIDERIRDGRFIEFEYQATTPEQAAEVDDDQQSSQMDDDAPHLFLVQHRYWDLDGDGFVEPWIATVHKPSGKLVRLQANYDLENARLNDEGELAKLPRYQYFVGFPFIPDPNGGYHGIGFGRLLKSIGETINTTLNQMLDAAHLQNKGGGFIGSGLNVKKSKLSVALNEWHVLNVPGQKIREAIVPHQFPGPSAALFQLLGLMLDAGKQVASVQEVLTGESSAKTTQPTTLLALIEQGLKVFTATIKRVFRSLKREFGLLYELNRRYPDEEAYAELIDWEPDEELLQQIEQLTMQAQQQGLPQPQIPPEIQQRLTPPSMASDYAFKDRNIIPVADPNAVTDMQTLAKAQVIQSTIGVQGVNVPEALRRIYEAAKIEDIDKLVQDQQGPDPMQVEAAKVELRAKNAKAVKDIAHANQIKIETAIKQQESQAKVGETMAKTAKTVAETEHERQNIAQEYAEMASGAYETDREMERALKEAQINKENAAARTAEKVDRAEGETA